MNILMEEDMQQGTCPEDFVSLKEWCSAYGGTVLSDWKLLHYHTRRIQRDLMEAGAMARVGRLIYLHKTRFWPEFQRIQCRLEKE